MTLLLAALLMQAPTVERGPVVGAVELRLPSDADRRLLEQVTGLVAVRRGQHLSRRAVQRSVEGLYATGKFADIVVRTTMRSDGLVVEFELTRKLTVGSVYLEGVRALPRPDVLAAARIEVGGEFWPERVAQSAEQVRELFWRRGYRDAVVTPESVSTDEGIAVGFVVEEGSPLLVSALNVVGDPGLPLEGLLDALGVKTGDVLNLDRLQEGVEVLRARLRIARYYRAKVEQPVVGEGGRVTIPVVAGPLYEVVFSGNTQFSRASLKPLLAYTGEELLDAAVRDRLAARLTRFYVYRGFHDAVVRVRDLPRADGRAVLQVEITEGPSITLAKVSFDGHKAIGAAELRDVLTRVIEAGAPRLPIEVHGTSDPMNAHGRLGEPFAAHLPAPPPNTVLVDEALVEAARGMTALYKERGYLTARVRADGAEIVGKVASARFTVEEGQQVRFRKIEGVQLPTGFRSETLSFSRADQVFSVAALEQVRTELVRELNRAGYLYARAEASYSVVEEGRLADCAVTAEPGPRVRVRKVLPVGQLRTDEALILSQATMVEGRPLDSESLYSTQSNLSALGIFRSVEVEMLSADTPEPLKTVLLRVRERPRIAGELGLGYFYADGPRIVFDVSAPNISGRAINASLHGQLNFVALSGPALQNSVDISDLPAWQQLGGRGNVSLQNRGVLPANIGARIDILGERVFRPQFRFSRIAAVPSLDWSTEFSIPRVDWARPKLTLQLQNETEVSFVARSGLRAAGELPISLQDQVRLRFLYGDFLLNTVRFAPTLDLRDDAFTPRRGFLLQGFGELTSAIATADEQGRPVPVSFTKLGGLASAYIPIGQRYVLAVSARYGTILRLAQDSVTPPVKRFFMGGVTTMRGFNEDQLVSEDLRTQYRDEVRECRVLANQDGCTPAANSIQQGRQVPSQGGELFALLKAELRFPAFAGIDLGVFAETGNLWLVAPTGQLALRTVAGAGLRYQTPIGPLALDLAFNPTQDVVINEPWVVVHFNIGVF